jgi:hypothetical protein
MFPFIHSNYRPWQRNRRRAWGVSQAYIAAVSVSLCGLTLSATAFAEQGNPSLRVEKERSDIKTEGAMMDEIYGLKPQVGVMVFKPVQNGVTQDTDARAMIGATLDVNLFRLASEDLRQFYGGVSTGILASHVGRADANLFGAGDNGGAGNVFLVPLNLKVGYNVNEAFRVSAHGGANAVYRTVGNRFNFGDQGNTAGDDWTLYPNVGLDFEFGKKVSLMVRPDFTITPEDEVFTGTFALSIPLG